MRKSPLRKTTEEFIQQIYNLVGDEYVVLEEYKGCKIDILLQHNCNFCNNNKFTTTPDEFLMGHRCKICGIEKRGKLHRKTQEKFNKEVYDLVKNEYTVLGDYKNTHTKILIRHNCEECNNYEWEITPNSFLEGKRCPKCAGNAKKTDEEFSLELKEKFNGEYIPLEKYKGDKNHIKIKHVICDNDWLVTPSNILRGYGCPVCSESKGEKTIRYLFNYNNIYYDSQYTFNNLIGTGGGLLKYDFAVFSDKEKSNLLLLIEYDGIFHFEQQYDNDGYKVIQIHDKLKNEYCLKHNIPLLRIPYYNFDNIESILKTELYKYNITRNLQK